MRTTGTGVYAIEQYHPRIQAYRKSMERIAVKVDGHREAVRRIGLPCAIIPRMIEKHYLGWANSAQRVLYGTMYASSAQTAGMRKRCKS